MSSTIAKPVMASQARAVDPQMQLPARPLWPRGWVPVWHSRECLVVLGGPQPVTLRGKAVATVLPALLPLLDGRRSSAELASALPQFGARAVHQVLSLLFLRGLLVQGEERPLAAASGGPLAEAADWAERHLDVTRVHRSVGAAMGSLQSARLLLLADSPAVFEILTTLAAQGLGAVELVSPDPALLEQALPIASAHFELITHHDQFDSFLTRAASEGLRCDAAAVVLREPDHERVRRLSEHAFGQRILYAVLGEHQLSIGPGLERGDAACMDCAVHSGALEPRSHGPFDACQQAWAAQRCAQRLLELLTRLTPVLSLNQVEWLDAAELRFHSRPVLRQFSCPHCGAGRGGQAGVALGGQGRAPLPWLYHSQTQHEAAQMLPKGHQEHYSSKNRKAAAGGYKVYRSCPAVALDALAPGSEIAALSELVRLALSKREEPGPDGQPVMKRLSPSGGSMTSQNLYLLSAGDELAPGVHAYDPRGRWQRISTAVPALDSLHLGTEHPGEVPTHVLLLSTAHARLESKYRSVAYRYAWYDSGVLLASLQFLAQAMGYELRVSADFNDDAATALIGTPMSNEFVTAVVTLYRREVRCS